MDKQKRVGILVFIILSVVLLLFGLNILSPNDIQGKVYEEKKTIGYGSGYSGEIIVEVTTKGETITGIVLLEYNDTPGMIDAAFDGVVKSILDSQSINNVDTVSGATGSSEGVIAAIKDGLLKQ